MICFPNFRNFSGENGKLSGPPSGFSDDQPDLLYGSLIVWYFPVRDLLNMRAHHREDKPLGN
jgi:hypothetical protein